MGPLTEQSETGGERPAPGDRGNVRPGSGVTQEGAAASVISCRSEGRVGRIDSFNINLRPLLGTGSFLPGKFAGLLRRGHVNHIPWWGGQGGGLDRLDVAERCRPKAETDSHPLLFCLVRERIRDGGKGIFARHPQDARPLLWDKCHE